MTEIACKWCRLCTPGVPGQPLQCQHCGHRADLPRVCCDCPTCRATRTLRGPVNAFIHNARKEESEHADPR